MSDQSARRARGTDRIAGSAPSQSAVHPVDAMLPPWQMFTVALQHVLVMYAGAIAVPLIIGAALKLPKDQIAFLISADLFAVGIATLIQSVGVWKFGIRLPVMMGVTFAAVGPMVAMANAGTGSADHPGRRHRVRPVHRADRTVLQQDAALLPARRHRHDHHRRSASRCCRSGSTGPAGAGEWPTSARRTT